MAYKIIDVEGIGNEYAQKLATVGIHTTDDLFNRCHDPKKCLEVAQKTGVSETLLTKWTRMADLMRVKGIGKQYAELLVSAGVTSVEKLREFQPDVLVRQLEELNSSRKLTAAPPKLGDVQGWMNEVRKPEFASVM